MTSGSLQEHLSSNGGIARLAAHARQLLELQGLLEAALPLALRPYARVANFRQGKLLIHAANGAVAAKVRQLSPRLAGDLSIKGAKLTQIDVRVQARAQGLRPPPHQRPATPGFRQKQGLTALAQGLPDGSPLKQALGRLLRAVKE